MSRHSLALEYTARGGTCTIGTLMTMELGTMSHRSSVLSKSLDCALEALTFGDCRSIYLIACSEDVSFDLCTKGVLLSVLKLELSYISLGAYASLLEVALLCFVNTMSVYDLLLAAGILVNNLILLVNEAYLYSTVAVIPSFRSCGGANYSNYNNYSIIGNQVFYN